MFKILSLCDGMSCAQIALNKLGITDYIYFAAEIKSHAIFCTQYNYPNTIQLGDLTKITYHNGLLKSSMGDYEIGNIDLVIFGSPCQTFSILCNSAARVGVKNKKKSGLFYDCLRILREVKPTYFLVENVASMSISNKELISNALGVQPIRLNSSLVSCSLRDRLYWTNINLSSIHIDDRKISLQSILTDGYTDKLKAGALVCKPLGGFNQPKIKLFCRYMYGVKNGTLIFKSKEHFIECCNNYEKITKKYKLNVKDVKPSFFSNLNESFDVYPFLDIRVLNVTESEICQTVPIGYTNCVTEIQAYDLLGDSFTVDIIAILLKPIFDGIPPININKKLVRRCV